jgi:hypothetical protein
LLVAEVEYQCCFCLQGIDRDDRAAVAIGVSNLWAEDGVQGFAAHSSCVAEHLNAMGLFDPNVLRDATDITPLVDRPARA